MIFLPAVVLIGGGLFYLNARDGVPTKQPVSVANDSLNGPKTNLTAADGILITARPYLVKKAKIGVVIIHDIDKDRSETMQFAEELAVACKCSTIAVDLRGHGQSSGNKEDFKNMYQDGLTAGKYLKDQGARSLFYIGFGFGAHVGLKAAIESEAEGLVVVSPDQDDRGINSTDLIKQYDKRLLVAASKTDSSSDRIASKFFNLSQVKDRQFAEYESGGHGIKMVYDTDLGKIISEWLKQTD